MQRGLPKDGVGVGQQRWRRLLVQGGVTGRREIVEDAALLLAQGVAHREQALHEAAAVGTVGAEAGVAPQHAMTKGSFGLVIGRLDALPSGEGPQRRLQVEEVGAGGRGRARHRQTAAQTTRPDERATARR